MSKEANPCFTMTSTYKVDDEAKHSRKQKKKVFCNKCRFHQPEAAVEQFFPLAKGTNITIDCVVPEISGFANSELKNENNDCEWYRKKRWWN